jgi:DNA-directed RNA polymerase subunit K/omega
MAKRAYEIVDYFESLQKGQYDEKKEPAIPCTSEDDPLYIAMEEYRQGKLLLH